MVVRRREVRQLHREVGALLALVLVEDPVRMLRRILDHHRRSLLHRHRERAEEMLRRVDLLADRLLVAVNRVDPHRLRARRAEVDVERADAVRRHDLRLFVWRVLALDVVAARIQHHLRRRVRRVNETEVLDLDRERHRIVNRHLAVVMARRLAVLDDAVEVLPAAAADARELRRRVRHRQRLGVRERLVVQRRDRCAGLRREPDAELDLRRALLVAVQELHRQVRRHFRVLLDLHRLGVRRGVDQVRAHRALARRQRHQVREHRLARLDRLAVLLEDEAHVQLVAFAEAAAQVALRARLVRLEEGRLHRRDGRTLLHLERHHERRGVADRVLHRQRRLVALVLRQVRRQLQRERHRLAVDEHDVVRRLHEAARDADRVALLLREVEVTPVVLHHHVERHRLALHAGERQRRRHRHGRSLLVGHLHGRGLVRAFGEERLGPRRRHHLRRHLDLRRLQVRTRQHAETAHVEDHLGLALRHHDRADARARVAHVVARTEDADDVRRQRIDGRKVLHPRLERHLDVGVLVRRGEAHLHLGHVPPVRRRRNRNRVVRVADRVGDRHVRLRRLDDAHRARHRRVLQEVADLVVAAARLRAHVDGRRRVLRRAPALQLERRARLARTDRHLQAVRAVHDLDVRRIVARDVEYRRVAGPHPDRRALLAARALDRRRRRDEVGDVGIDVAPHRRIGRRRARVKVDRLHLQVRLRERIVDERTARVRRLRHVVGMVVLVDEVAAREIAVVIPEVPQVVGGKDLRVHVREEVVGVLHAALVGNLALVVEKLDRKPQVARLHRVAEIEVGVVGVRRVLAADLTRHRADLDILRRIDAAAHRDADLRRLIHELQLLQRLRRRVVQTELPGLRRIRHGIARSLQPALVDQTHEEVGLLAHAQVARVVDASILHRLDRADVAVRVTPRKKGKRHRQRGNRNRRDLDHGFLDLHISTPHFEIFP